MQTNDPTSSRFYGRRKGRPLRRGMQALLIDKKTKPYVQIDASRTPWVVVKPANACEDAGYSLIFAGDAGNKAKKLKKSVPDLWA